MLQQTQVATVIPYFERFMSRFPDLGELARADLSEVLAAWSGLGYYARARNLHAAARRCLETNDGKLPTTRKDLEALPGIGRSTAAAIVSLAHGERAAILDGNAKRVLARYHAIRGWPGERAVEKRLWHLAEAETPARDVAAYTQAIMDIGASICTRANPGCEACPLAPGCVAHAMHREADFPAPRPRRKRPLRAKRYARIERDGELLFEQRPPHGVWGGLLCLPEITDNVEARDWCRERLGLQAKNARELAAFRHEFTHFRLRARVIALEVAGEAAMEGGRYRWIEPEAALQMGLPAPIRSWLANSNV
jgi:A/G-specific adenine glycosylase